MLSLQAKHRGYLVKTLNKKEKDFHQWFYAFDPLLAGTIRYIYIYLYRINRSPPKGCTETKSKSSGRNRNWKKFRPEPEVLFFEPALSHPSILRKFIYVFIYLSTYLFIFLDLGRIRFAQSQLD